MTQPVYRGNKHMWNVARRCCDGRTLLSPQYQGELSASEPWVVDGKVIDPVSHLYAYDVAVYRERRNIGLHAFSLLPNHHHVFASDRGEKVSNVGGFCGDVNSQVARGVAKLRGRRGKVFEPNDFYPFLVFTEEDAWDAMLYTLLQHVRHGLATEPRRWVGFALTMELVESALVGGGFEIPIPDWYHRRQIRPAEERRGQQPLPARALLRLSVPPVFGDRSPRDWCQELRARLEAERVRILQGREQEIPTPEQCAAFPVNVPIPHSREFNGGNRHARTRVSTRFADVRERGNALLKAFRADVAQATACRDDAEGSRPHLFPAGCYRATLSEQVGCRSERTCPTSMTPLSERVPRDYPPFGRLNMLARHGVVETPRDRLEGATSVSPLRIELTETTDVEQLETPDPLPATESAVAVVVLLAAGSAEAWSVVEDRVVDHSVLDAVERWVSERRADFGERAPPCVTRDAS